MVATTLAPSPPRLHPIRPVSTPLATETPAASLLASAEERVLGRTLALGQQAARQLDALQEQGRPVAPTVRQRLAAQTRAGQQARDRLIAACAPPVATLAAQYSGYGIGREDLVQEGWTGVVQAAAHFDPAKGAHFSRYARWWVRQAILRALTNQSRLVRLPAGVVTAVRQIAAIQQQWAQMESAAPTADDLAALTGLPLHRVRQVLAVMAPPLSLDAPGTDDPDAPALGQALADTIHPAPDTLSVQAVARRELAAALAALDPLPRQVLAWRYGLVDGHTYTLEEVGVILRRPVAEIHQHEAAGLVALRANPLLHA